MATTHTSSTEATCGATHPFITHDSGDDVVCTLPAGHDGEHQDHCNVDNGEVICFVQTTDNTPLAPGDGVILPTGARATVVFGPEIRPDHAMVAFGAASVWFPTSDLRRA